MGIVLALVLTAPMVGVQTDGTVPCDAKGFARALATLRPELEIVPLDFASSAPAGAWLARIEGLESDQAVLRVSEGPTPLVRSLTGEDCTRALQTAASIVDGLIEQLPNPRLDSGPRRAPATRRTSLSAWLGAGILQGPIQWVPSFALGARFGLGWVELVGSIDVGLPASFPLATVDEGPVGSYQAVPIDLELGAGWGPRLGPGRMSVDGSVGLALASFSTNPLPGNAHLFEIQSQIAAQFFLAASAGYVFELPAHFFVGPRIEERWAPGHSTVTVEGAVAGDHVMTRVWTFTATGVAGWRFF